MRSDSLAYTLTLSVAESSTPDAELLLRFAETGDAAAFELLVRRHAELVWRVCRSELPGDRHSAEDAFQTTFLVLARKARSVRGDTVAGYLFRVARNAALRVRKRIGNVSAGAVEVGVEPAEPYECSAAVIEEVERLPDKFRLPVLLCFFEDCTHAEAANRLGWAVGTVASRLARAKDRLRIRLTHRGLTLPAALAGIGVPALTVRAAVTMATTPSAVPTLLTELSREVLIVMAQAKAKWIGAGVLTALLLTGGLGMMVLTAGPAPDEPKPVAKQNPKPPVKETPEAAEIRKLQGVWKVTKIVNERGVAPAKEIEPMRLEFVGSTFDGPHEFQKKTPFTLDLTTSPKQMTSQPTPDITEASIYELKGDTLRICSLSGGQQVPTEFKVAKGVDGMLIELERVPVLPLPKSMDNVPELKDLAGEWTLTEDGKKAGIVEIYRDMMWTTHEGKTEKAIITLDVKKQYFDITPITGPKDRIGKPVLGLFTWEENQIEIFTEPLGDERTTEAKTSKSVIVIILKRVKKK